MNLKALDIFLLTKLTSQQVDHVTCLECCKYFIAPETATCGHTLCHTCWRRRRTCPSCAAPLEKRSLKLNLPMQARTQHIQSLAEEFEKLFNIKLDEFVLDLPSIATESSNDPTKNVKDWLASSQNQFSAPLPSSEPYTQDATNLIKLPPSKIQIHSSTKKSASPETVICFQQPQDDWDKIEQLPDTEDFIANNKENIGSMNKPTIPSYEDNEYTTDHPRRSSRKRESNHSEPVLKAPDTSLDRHSSKNSSLEIEKKSTKAKQNWNNVKRMRKEFSKLNKLNRNKLNVSIEMCKKSTINKPNIDIDQQNIPKHDSQPPLYTIEDNTPTIDHENKDKENVKVIENIIKNHESCVPKLTNQEIHIPNETNSLINPLSILDNINSAQESVCGNNVSQTHLQNKSTKMSFLRKSFLCPKQPTENNIRTINIDNSDAESFNNDDIEITIKIGNTLTNIVIKKKSNDVQLKVNADREVQTSLGSNSIISANKVIPDLQNNNIQDIGKDKKVSVSEAENNNVKVNSDDGNKLQKSTYTKKNTASAETATAQFEITESVEKELSNIMECNELHKNYNVNSSNIENEIPTSSKFTQESLQKKIHKNNNNVEDMEDLDIFDNGSAHVQPVEPLINSKHIISEILVSTVKTNKMDNLSHKRDREINDEDERNEMQSTKKFKSNSIDTDIRNISQQKNKYDIVADSDSINYDVVLNQVFANIDTDIEKSQTLKKNSNNNKPEPQHTQDIIESQRIQIKSINMSLSNNQLCAKEIVNEKYSENVFSIIEKDTDTIDSNKKRNNEEVCTQNHIDNLLTPGMCLDLIETEVGNVPTSTDIIDKEVCTPYHEPDDSDRSVVEETPQKSISFSKQKNKNELNLVKDDSDATKIVNSSQVDKSIINVSDSDAKSIKSSKDVTNIEPERKLTSETPLTINKFINYIKHNSTPVARKSLNFDSKSVDEDDPEQTLCPSSVVGKTTQEKEFMTKAFEQTPKSPVKKPLTTNNIKVNELQFCIAGSCLAPADLNNVKLLCRKRNWKYVDKYTNELTHLVVSVDDENKSQRSVKYMCALAASKWIVSNQWVEACLKTNLVLGENHYEVLDGTGEPGPKRSRLSKKKLFESITFFCMPPFSVLDPNTLKDMLESSGGRVVNEAKAVKATCDAPALLLAEPEHTQEDRFMYLALELGIVPVNYEWVLNCLGSYSLCSIHDLLLCPSALLPPETSKWPTVLISRDSE